MRQRFIGKLGCGGYNARHLIARNAAQIFLG